MSPVNHALLSRLPKADLHCHLDGSIRPATLLELAHEHGVEVPGLGEVRDALLDPAAPGHEDAIRAVREACHAGKLCDDLADYLKAFDFTVACMADEAALERIAYELAEDAHNENVRWLEVRYAPCLMLRHDMTMDQAVAAAARGLDRAEQDFGIRSGQILCGLRHDSVELTVETAHLTSHLFKAGNKHRVLGYDLAGAEVGFPADMFEDALEICSEQGVPITLHAGEARGADAIDESVSLGADRIGHGTRLPEDMELLKLLAWEQVPMEVCLTSNVQTRTIKDYGDHPLKLWLAHDLPFSLATDNRLMSDVTVTDEYTYAVEHFDLGPRQLLRIAMNGFLYSFAPEQVYDELVDKAEQELSDLLTP